MFSESLRQFFELAVMFRHHSFLSLLLLGLDEHLNRIQAYKNVCQRNSEEEIILTGDKYRFTDQVNVE